MAFLNPAYKLTLGNRVIDTTAEPKASTMVSLHVTLDLDTPADSFSVVLARVGKSATSSGSAAASAAAGAAGAAKGALSSALGGGGGGNSGKFPPDLGDSVSIELGFADDGGLTQVVSGKVTSVEPELTQTRIFGFSAGQAALHTFVEQAYESQSAGAIVRALAGKAGVDVATADDGIDYPAYVVDGRRSVFHHMLDLAALNGFDLYIRPDGKLVFEEFQGGKTVHVFEYAKEIVALDIVRTPPLATKVEAWGESPTGSDGANAWPWLTKDFSNSKGSAGSGDSLYLLQQPALRTSAAARTAAEAALRTITRRGLRGELHTWGRPEVKLGDAIQLRSLPDASLNQNYQVRSVRHRITKLGGFTTIIGFRAI